MKQPNFWSVNPAGLRVAILLSTARRQAIWHDLRQTYGYFAYRQLARVKDAYRPPPPF